MLARNALLLALDPGQVLHAQGLAPDPWQRDLTLDAAFLARFRRAADGAMGRREDGVTEEAIDSSDLVAPSSGRPVPSKPWLRLDNENLWS